MNQFKLKMQNNVLVLILSMFLLGITSCNQSKEKTTDKVVTEAPSSTINEAVFMGNIKDVKAHIAVKTNLNKKDDYGSTPLHVAATFGKTEVAILLIENGASLSEKSADGSTPLHTAAFFGRTEIVKSLLKNNVDISARNNYNTTALESVSTSFEDVKPIYDQLSKDLGPFGLKLDYDQLKVNRTAIKELLTAKSN